MRLFVSVDPDGLEDAVEEIQEPLAGLPGLNLVDPEQAHVTVKFLGDGPEDGGMEDGSPKDDDTDGGDDDTDGGHDPDALDDALSGAIEEANVGSFDAEFEGLGVFPSIEYISVVWLGVGEGSVELTRLHEAVERRTTDLGYTPEDHDFTPHVTLARMSHAAAKAEVQEYVREGVAEVGGRQIEELRLTKSTLTDDGPVYETVESYPLG